MAVSQSRAQSLRRLYTSGQESDASVYKTEMFLEDPALLSIKSWNCCPVPMRAKQQTNKQRKAQTNSPNQIKAISKQFQTLRRTCLLITADSVA